MYAKIENFDLVIKSIVGNRVIDLRTISSLSISNKRNIIELEIPGSSGNVLQDMGIEPTSFSIEGDLIGEGSSKAVEQLMDHYDLGNSLSFSSDLSAISEVHKVKIEKLSCKYVPGSVGKYHFSITLTEVKSP